MENNEKDRGEIIHYGSIEESLNKKEFYGLENFDRILNKKFNNLETLTLDGTENNNHQKQFCMWYDHSNNVYIEYKWNESRYNNEFNIILRGSEEDRKEVIETIVDAKLEYNATKEVGVA